MSDYLCPKDRYRFLLHAVSIILRKMLIKLPITLCRNGKIVYKKEISRADKFCQSLKLLTCKSHSHIFFLFG